MSTVGQGVAQVGTAAVQGLAAKGEKFVDAAGNVYSVLTDATGAATNFVMDKAGMIYDVTKMAGTFLIENTLNYPKDILESAAETREELMAAAAKGVDAAKALGQFAMDARPTLPPVKEMLHPKAWGQAAMKTGMKMSTAYDDLYADVGGLVTDFEEKYCTPASLSKSKKKPGFFKMPSFFFKVGLGDCVVGHTYDNSTHYGKGPIELNCTKPFVSYGHVEGEWTSKHHTAPSFTSKECKITKEHGEADSLVLFTFDGKVLPDAKSLTQSVSDTLGKAVGGLANAGQNIAGQVTNFIGDLEKEHGNLENLVKAYEGLPQPDF